MGGEDSEEVAYPNLVASYEAHVAAEAANPAPIPVFSKEDRQLPFVEVRRSERGGVANRVNRDQGYKG